MIGEIEKSKLNALEKKYASKTQNTIIRHMLSNNQLSSVTKSKDELERVVENYNFNLEVKTLPVSDQKQSGRCWIFAASNLLREIISKKLDIDGQFEISQNYISYYDKLEKYNYYFENLIKLALNGKTHDSRKVCLLLDGVSDGGQWDMFCNVVKKYGIVPKAAYPETYQSEHTADTNMVCNTAMRHYAHDIFDYYNQHSEESDCVDQLYKIKDEWFKKIYDCLTSAFGIPPKKFVFDYTKKDGSKCRISSTPLDFYKQYTSDALDNYVSIINAPTEDKQFNKTYTVEMVNNVVGGKEIQHLNVEMSRMEQLIIEQLKEDSIVWFGSDVTYYKDRENGVWDTKSFDYATPFDITLAFDKKDMLDWDHAAMNHAMCLTGVQLDDDGTTPIRWKVENSWGDKNGKDGYFVMSEDFFKKFVFQAAINKKYLNEVELKALEQESIRLKPWDPFGTLAD